MNFIIYEDEIKFIQYYKNIIHKLMGSSNLNYKIIVIDKFDDKAQKCICETVGNKIYILDIEVPGKTGIDLARKIRNNGDWISPIIVVTSHEEFKSVGYTAKILMLDFISKNENIEKNLYESLQIALEINSQKKNLCIMVHGEMYQIPYQDILYIEKNINDNFSTIVTKTKNYQIRKTISKLESDFENDSSFIKTHRSFLVNIKNIEYIDFENGIIFFNNKKTALISRANKKKLKERMDVC